MPHDSSIQSHLSVCSLLGDGLKTRSSYLTLDGCVFEDNGQTGFTYDPKLPLETAFNIRKSIPADEITNIDISLFGTTQRVSPSILTRPTELMAYQLQ